MGTLTLPQLIPPALLIEQLHIQHGQHAVVSDLALHLPQGGSLGIVGESGCGKSSLLKAVAGVDNHWQGSIQLLGNPLRQQRTKAQRRHLQMVFQDPLASLNPAHTVDEILREPLQIHGFDQQEARILKALDNVALPRALRFRFPSQLSGGQRQRIGIARALLVEPQVLLLDEPTSALDVSVQAEVLNLLLELRRELGLSYLLVSHDLAVVAHLCEQVAIMQHGRFVELSSREQLAAGTLIHPYSRELFNAAAL
ncbi:ABC transporter ATP-binding protein [Pseudomonas sp. 5P_3.1_Bac2]|uniref:ABC transporter ATP-binding protein n=1 Tax=Pseudomonas sp. 5P_3.1_Bac2 TaxID=2971617 RepID=UPI0021CA31BC|nr:ABC transporter ATP-binding protein [Pseudomonas sp. 5P_3.1_Bac2]MCU1716852.1 ABC transporter ATP-binding protein [Pseudomonas sp. 5P_3.1_Bac2]